MDQCCCGNLQFIIPCALISNYVWHVLISESLNICPLQKVKQIVSFVAMMLSSSVCNADRLCMLVWLQWISLNLFCLTDENESRPERWQTHSYMWNTTEMISSNQKDMSFVLNGLRNANRPNLSNYFLRCLIMFLCVSPSVSLFLSVDLMSRGGRGWGRQSCPPLHLFSCPSFMLESVSCPQLTIHQSIHTWYWSVILLTLSFTVPHTSAHYVQSLLFSACLGGLHTSDRHWAELDLHLSQHYILAKVKTRAVDVSKY